MKTKLPKRVNGWVDRHGRQRYYLRLPGQKGVPLPSPAWSPEFMAAYEAALSGRPAPMTARPVSAARISSVNPQKQSKVSSYVYFVRYGVRVKIGTTANVQARFQNLKTAIPGKARIYYVTPGNQALEKELHDLFAADRVNGEWFNWSDAMVKWIVSDEERRADERQWISV